MFSPVCCLVVVSENIRLGFIVAARYRAFLFNPVCCLVVVSENIRLSFIVATRYGLVCLVLFAVLL